MLAALSTDDLEARIAEGLLWLAAHYSDLDWNWLIGEVQRKEIQNRLGFIVTSARRMAEGMGDWRGLDKLREVEDTLKKIRLDREDTLCERSLSQAERKWLLDSRSEDARYWRLLTDLSMDRLLSYSG